MEAPTSRRRRLEAIAIYVGVAALSLIAGAVALRLWRGNLHIPFVYSGDALFFGMEVKSIVDNGWCLTVPQLAAPGGLQLHDFPPQFDALHLLTIRLMSVLSGDWAVLFNVYYLLGFPLIALSALAVLRHFRVSWAPATVVSVLYAFLPSRLFKNQHHIFLDTFYQVPLAILVVLWVHGASPPLTREPRQGPWPGLEIRAGRSLVAAAICVVVGLTSLYYAYFTMWLLVVAGIGGSLARRSLRNVVSGIGLAAVVGAAAGALSLPTLLYQAKHGPNNSVVQRVPGEAEANGMRIAQLVLPIDGHPVPVLRRLKERYARTAPLRGESAATSLGTVGTAGFLALLGLALWGWRRRTGGDDEVEDKLVGPLVTLNLAAVLLGTIGGFGSLFALLVSPLFRTYCRLNVFISFLSLFAVALALERLWRRHRRAALFVLPAIAVLGLCDQGCFLIRPRYDQNKIMYASDAALVGQIERAVPPNAMIYQLPFQMFPEASRSQRLDPYDLLEPYLHSRSLRWSFGAINGRDGETWSREMARLAPAALIQKATLAGFAGILIDRPGYADNAVALESALRAHLPQPPVISADGRRAFFRLATP